MDGRDREPALSILLTWGALPREPAMRLLSDGGAPVRLVAVEGGLLAGLAVAEPELGPGDDTMRVAVVVAFEARGKGIGGVLWDRFADGLGGRTLRCTVADDDAVALRFAASRRFQPVSQVSVSALELPPPEGRKLPSPPDGLRMGRPADLRTAYEAFVVCCAEIPDLGGAIPRFDEWTGIVGPRAESVVATLDGQPVACCFATPADHGIWHVLMTGVAPTHRRRGFGAAVKAAMEQRAMEAGVRTLTTTTLITNDHINELNARLGYRRRRGWVRLERPSS